MTTSIRRFCFRPYDVSLFATGFDSPYPIADRFAGEIGGPIFQDLNGPQLETDVIYSIAWRFSF